MTRHPYGPDELDRHDPAIDEAATRLEEYASASGGEPPMDLAARIRAAIDAEPPVAIGWWAGFLAWRHGGPARMAAAAGVVVLAVAGALALGEIARNARDDDVGSSPSAIPVPSSSPSAVPTPIPSPSPSLIPSPSPTLTPSPTDEEESPDATDDEDDVATPSPSESDHSGPGEGGGGGSGGGGSGSGSDD